LPREGPTTRGIDIFHVEFPLEDGGLFRLNIWDFGGQEIYHAAHRFFFTRNSLYVLVDDTRRDDRSVHDHTFKYWLEAIEVLADSSPVLIFQNKKGGRSKRIATAEIRHRFPNVVDVFGADLSQPDSADELRDAIQTNAARLSHVGDTIPASWVDIRAEIAELSYTEALISEETYFEIYSRHLPSDEGAARRLSSYLHDLGIFLHFQDDPLLRRLLILDHDWATNAVFGLVDDEVTRDNGGRFGNEDLLRIWPGDAYRNRHPEILQLLQQFELIYPVASKADSWMVPELLAVERPEQMIGWETPEDLTIVYRYEFMPRGLASRLIVREFPGIKDQSLVWRNGAFLTFGTTTLLIESKSADEITLRARGPEAKEVLSKVRYDLEEINHSYSGLTNGSQVHALIPCNCDQCRANIHPTLYDLQDLLQRSRDPQAPRTVNCGSSYADVKIGHLLHGVDIDTPATTSPFERTLVRSTQVHSGNTALLVQQDDFAEIAAAVETTTQRAVTSRLVALATVAVSVVGAIVTLIEYLR